MAEPLPNIHMVNASPPVFLSYYLLKSIYYLCALDLAGQPSWAAFPLHLHVGGLSLLYLSGVVLCPSCGKIFSSYSLCLFPGILKVPPLSPSPAIGCWQLYFPIRANWGAGTLSADWVPM